MKHVGRLGDGVEEALSCRGIERSNFSSGAYCAKTTGAAG